MPVQFDSLTDFFAMGGHGLYVWLSYAIAMLVFVYNMVASRVKRRVFFKQARRRLRRDLNKQHESKTS
ncbi:MAG: heme exporter protein CcmD [Methylococcales bacterium]|nr:heme exporter protein CcmD [Methylococcales bacterium]